MRAIQGCPSLFLINIGGLPPQLTCSRLNLGFLNNATVGFQYLHGDFGNLTTTLGTPTQFQVTSGVKVTTDSAMARFTFPLAENTSPMPSDRVFVNYDYFKGLH